jgi:hypothetical protein|tara:strand:- start:4567 stop:5127 length:561 start_codon:yes stop_codon:yes gene_type:complete
MKKNLLILIFGILTTLNYAQEKIDIKTEKVWRVNFLNPAIELEIPVSKKATFSASFGIGYGAPYDKISVSPYNEFLYSFNPFLDLQYKRFYNFHKRKSKNLNTDNNSGNFVSLRVLTRGNTIESNFTRSSNFDFAFGPTWGIQRKYGKNFHLLFDIGPQYYFDTNGNGGIWPIMIQLNLGFNLKNK